MYNLKTIVGLAFVCGAMVATPIWAQTSNDSPKSQSEVASEIRALKYRNVGPMRGGRATAVVGVVGDDQTYYMGGVGGVWKTTDAGESWNNVTDGYVGSSSVGDIDVSRSHPDHVIVGMGESAFRREMSSHGDGVYLSRDAGKTWKHLGFKDGRQISSVKFHPSDPQTIWVGVQGDPWKNSFARGLYKSVDGGKSWKQTLFVNESTGVVDLKCDLNNPDVLYLSMWDFQHSPWYLRSGGDGCGLYKSIDGGESWEKLDKGLPSKVGKMGIAVSEADSNRVYAVIEADESEAGLYRSNDAGQSWSVVNKDDTLHTRSWYYMHLFTDPTDSDGVYVLNAGASYSTDGGKTISRIRNRHSDTHDLWVNPDNNKNLILADDGGAAISFDGGKTWSTQHNQPTAQFYRVNVDNKYHYRIYGGQQDNGTVALLSSSRGSEDDYYSVGGCENAFIAFDPDNPRYFYGSCYLGQISEYDLELKVRRDVRADPYMGFGVSPKFRKYRAHWNAPVASSPHDHSIIYHGTNKLLRTKDRGQTWEELSPDLTRNEVEKQGAGAGPITNEVLESYNTLTYVMESPHEKGVIWTGADDGLVHVTRDDGKNWQNVTPPDLGAGIVNAIEVSPHDPATAYLAVTRHKFGDHAPLIYRTRDYGQTWMQIAEGLPKDGHFVRVVREDPVRKDLLFAGTESGMFYSINGGETWSSLQLNLPHVGISDLIIQRQDLVVATRGRAFWVLDDITPLREMSEKTTQAKVHLFTPETAYRIRSRIGGKRDAKLYYSLKDDAEDLKVEFLLDGKVVRRFDKSSKGKKPEAKAGLNTFTWRFDDDKKTPKIEAMYSGRPVTAPAFPIGKYLVRITANGETAERDLILKMDPRLEIDEQDMAAQYDVSLKAYAMVEELMYSIKSMRDIKSQVESQLAPLKRAGKLKEQKELVEASKKLLKAISDWEASLHDKRRTNVQNTITYPEKLAEDIVSISSVVSRALPPLTQGMQERFADAQARWKTKAEERDAILANELAEYVKAYKAADVAVVEVMPFTRPEEKKESQDKTSKEKASSETSKH